MFEWRGSATLCVDTETTGPNPEEAIIVELGAAWYSGPGKTPPEFVRLGTLINPGVPIPLASTEIHGITDDAVKDAPKLGDVAAAFLNHVHEAKVLCAYNWPYDARVLERALGDRWREAIAGKVILDPLVVMQGLRPFRFWKGKGRHRLTSVAKRLGLVRRGSAHRASSDADLALQVLHCVADKLPSDGAQAAALIEATRAEIQADRAAWRARSKNQNQQVMTLREPDGA